MKVNLLTLLFIFGIHSITSTKYVIIKDFQSHVFDPKTIAISYKVVNGTFLNYNLTILKIHNVKVLCTLRVKLQTKGKAKSVLNWKHMDFCRFLEIYRKDRIFRPIFSKIFQASYIDSCPMREGFYYLKNAYFDADLLGMILPHGVYYSQLDVSLMKDGIVRLINLQTKLLLL